MGTLLILDDDAERMQAFPEAIERLALDVDVHKWWNAPRMIAEFDQYLRTAELISLDHDLYKQEDADPDPGTGRDVANVLATRSPVCPVIVHSTNTDAAWGMYNELTFNGWSVEIVHHLNQMDWIVDVWLPVARRLLSLA